MLNLQVLMPMAGRGSRFKKQGYQLPKPLILVQEEPMFVSAISSFSELTVQKDYIFIVLKEHNLGYQLKYKIQDKVHNSKVIEIDEVTRGPVETCLHAASVMSPENPLVVLDCDLKFHSKPYLDAIANVCSGQSDVDGALVYFKSTEPIYSYALIESGVVTKTAEKKVISDCALVGAYFFSKAGDFITAAKHLMEHKPNPEYYVSGLFNELIAQGKKIAAYPVDNYRSFGTPADL